MFLNALMVLYISVTGGQDVRGRGLVVGLVRIRALQSNPKYGYLKALSYGPPKHPKAPCGALRRLRRLLRQFSSFLFSPTPREKCTVS